MIWKRSLTRFMLVIVKNGAVVGKILKSFGWCKMKKIFDWMKWGYSWQDEGQFGEVYINCPCGHKIEHEGISTQYNENEDEGHIMCSECKRKYTIKMNIDMYEEELE